LRHPKKLNLVQVPGTNSYDISGFAWNKTVVPGATATFGFCADGYGPRAKVVSASGAPFGTDAAGLTATYFDNADLTGPSVSRIDRGINFLWGERGPAATIGPDTFSARWTGSITPSFSETYAFTTTTDNGVRLWIGGQLLVDDWTETTPQGSELRSHAATIALEAGRHYELKMEYFESTGNAQAVLEWSSSSQPRAVVPASAFMTAIEPGEPGACDVTMNVRVDTTVHPIPAEIYGINSATAARIAEDRLGSTRFGGNRCSAYNWETNASNAGSDYQFQNDGFLSSSNAPGQAIAQLLSDTADHAMTTVVTIPVGGYVAADKRGDGDVRSTPDYLQTRFFGNYADHDGPLPLVPDATDRSVFQSEFVNWATLTYPTTKIAFMLDNEPDLWSSTHAEIWPVKPTYDDVTSRNAEYAAMIHRRVPNATVVGYGSYGWTGWETLQGSPDAQTKGRFLDYYLDKMREAEQTYGHRVVDAMDIHWYPEARGDNTRITENCTTAGCVAARVQAPRSLWDATYTEDSWIAQWMTKGPIVLLSRMKASIEAHYPGTKLAINEWNYGAGSHISGGIATADVLGIFGRDGVAMANNWMGEPSEFAHGAFQIFRNYDMVGSAFGDTSIGAVASDNDLASVYAAYDGKDRNRVTIVAINKSATAKTAGIRVAHQRSFRSAQVYVLSTAAWSEYYHIAHPQVADSIHTVATNAFSYVMPAYSVSIIVPSMDEDVAKGPSWPPPPAPPQFGGWTFDTTLNSWTSSSNAGGTIAWDGTTGNPNPGSVKINCPFSKTGQNVTVHIGEPKVDLTGKKITLRLRSDGNFSGGVIFYVMSRWRDWSHYTWIGQGWGVPGTNWITMTFDTNAAKASNPNFNPSIIADMGIQIQSNASSKPTTLWLDSVQYPLATP
jgi:hypothetical protein